jgi:ubiquinone/menaquinone biosynthesis C-methylase UbiE
MIPEYDNITAFHFASFRPSLLLQILRECLDKDASFYNGLDIGCGTGQSSIALSNFCDQVIGVDPSREMLSKSLTHSNVTYKYSDCLHFDFPNGYFDIITLVGSLYYAKTQQLLNEIVRLSKRSAKIIIYDFELALDIMLKNLGVNNEQNYNYLVNFEGLNQNKVQVENEHKKVMSFKISHSNISLILLSSKDNYNLIKKTLGGNDLF